MAKFIACCNIIISQVQKDTDRIFNLNAFVSKQ